MISTVAPATGAPVAIDCTNTSCEPSTERFATSPRSVTTSRRASVSRPPTASFQLSPYSRAAASSRSHACTRTRKMPRRSPPSASSPFESRNSPRSTASYCALPGGAGGSSSTRTKRSATFAASNDQLENIGIAKLPLRLRDQMLQLTRQQPARPRRGSLRTLRANRLSVFSPDIDSSEPWCRMLSSRGNSGTRMMRSTASPS